MKKLFTAMFALAAGVSVAAAADLPSKKAAAAPAVSTNDSASGYYVGGNIGTNYITVKDYTWNTSPFSIGGVAGYEWNKYFRTEATFDYTSKEKPTTTQSGQLAFVNAVGQFNVPNTSFTPYVLAGVGYGFNSWGKNKSDLTDDANLLYNFGGGVRYNVNKSVDLDARYRYIKNFDGAEIANNNIVSIGANYKF